MSLPHPLYCLSSMFRQSFFIPAAPLTSANLPDQTSRVFLITGGYTGVGYEVASILYAHHATVWIAGRSESKASAAVERLQASHPESRGSVHFLKIDLSDLTTVKPAVEDFLRRNESGKLHWLDNNAGVMVPPAGSVGAQGHDLQLVTNVYAPFLLTKLLLPILRRTAEGEATRGVVRVSWAGSAASFLSAPRGGIAWERDGKEIVGAGKDPQGVYSVTKSANWWLAREFGRRFGDQDGVMHNAFNPGNLKSELQRTVKEVSGAVAHWLIYNVLCFPPVNGAHTELYAGLSRDLSLEKGDQGAWIVPWGQKSVMRPDILEEAAKTGKDAIGDRLWEWCERIVHEYE